MLADFEMKPDAPSSSARRMVSGSSCADTTTSGTVALMPRSEISPERPAAPGMARSSSTRSMSSLPATSSLGAVEIAGLEDGGDVAEPGQRLLQRAAEKRVVVRDHELVARRQMSLPPAPRLMCLRGHGRRLCGGGGPFQATMPVLPASFRLRSCPCPARPAARFSFSKSFTMPMKLRKKRSM